MGSIFPAVGVYKEIGRVQFPVLGDLKASEAGLAVLLSHLKLETGLEKLLFLDPNRNVC